jgi:seryl-tRNA synthetase
MLDPAYVRDHIDEVRAGLRNRGLDPDRALEEIATLETARRRIIPDLEGLKRQQNTSGDEIARAKRQGKDTAPIQEANRARAAQIKQLGVQLDSVEHQREVALLALPNLPHPTVPVGKSADANKEVRRNGEPRVFDFDPKPHWDLGPELGILDFERAAKIAGSRFAVLSGAGARLSRALINFMLDLHTREHGYREVEPPFPATCRSSRRICSRLPANGICTWYRPPKCRSRTFTVARFSTAASCRFRTPPTRPASGAKPAPMARTSVASSASTSSTRSS